MRKLSIFILTAALFAACSNSTSSDDNNLEEISTAIVYSFDHLGETYEPLEQIGTSTLTRTEEGLSYSITASGLEPGTAVTLWLIIFNEPEHCEDDCFDPDLFNPDTQADVTFGGDGHVIGSSGEATFSGSRDAGDNSGSIMGEWFELPEHGLINPLEAEILFILHNHGPVIEGLEEEMISTFNAGCGPDLMEGAPPVPESLGTYGPNTCTDDGIAVHQPSAF